MVETAKQKPTRILVAHIHDSTREIYETILSDEFGDSVVIDTCKNNGLAWDRLQETQYDILFADEPVNVPGSLTDKFDVVAKVAEAKSQNDPRFTNLKIIPVTTKPQPIEPRELTKERANIDPFAGLNSIYSAVREVLEANRS